MTEAPHDDETVLSQASESAVCGIVMPIADFDGRTSVHWSNVLDLINRAIRKAGLSPQPVWVSPETDVIHERILTNLFSFPMIVADVSALNPNVMFEVGMRMTTSLPIVLVTDDKTMLPFDTKLIDHVFYERGLPFHAMERFIDDVSARIKSVYAAHLASKYRPFVARFAPKLVTPLTEEVSSDQRISRQLEKIEESIALLSESMPSLGVGKTRSSLDPAQDRLGGPPDLTTPLAGQAEIEVTAGLTLLPVIAALDWDPRMHQLRVRLDPALHGKAKREALLLVLKTIAEGEAKAAVRHEELRLEEFHRRGVMPS